MKADYQGEQSPSDISNGIFCHNIIRISPAVIPLVNWIRLQVLFLEIIIKKLHLEGVIKSRALNMLLDLVIKSYSMLQ